MSHQTHLNSFKSIARPVSECDYGALFSMSPSKTDPGCTNFVKVLLEFESNSLEIVDVILLFSTVVMLV